MKTAKQWIEESNWTPELKELFWERAGDLEEDDGDIVHIDIYHLMVRAFGWSETPEGFDFWNDVANGERTDIDRPAPTHAEIVEEVDEAIAKVRDQEYETLMRTLLEGLKIEEVRSGNDDFTRGFNTGIREMNEKIDEAIKKLEL